MEYNLTNLWIVYIVSFILTWIVGLSVPLLIRYVFLRRPINKTPAIVIVAILLFLQLALWISLGSTNKSHAVLFFVAYVSYCILRKHNKVEYEAIKNKDDIDKGATIKENDIIENQPNKIGHNKSKSNKVIWIIIILMLVIIGVGILLSTLISKQNILIENLTLPKTNKDSSSFEQIGNLYRNTKYNFRIKFPEGWETKPGDGLHILQKAVSGNYIISVGVIEMPAELIELIDKTTTIKDIVTLSEFKESTIGGVQEKSPGAKLLDYGETRLDSLPTYWMKYSAPYSALDINIESTNLLYQLFHKNFLYCISVGAPSSEFEIMEQEFKKSILTFVIENY